MAHPEDGGIVMHAPTWCGLIHSQILDFRSTEYYVLVWFLDGWNEFGWWPVLKYE